MSDPNELDDKERIQVTRTTAENPRLLVRQKIALLATQIEVLGEQITRLKAQQHANQTEMDTLKKSLRQEMPSTPD